MNQTVLIACGDTDLCEVFRMFLTGRGYQVETASNALACLEKLCQLRPAVLVLDLELRWGGGDGVLAWLQEEGDRVWVPVILTATAGAWQDVAEFMAPPVVKYLSKPFSLTALLDSIRAAAAVADEEQPKAGRTVACSEFFLA